jgi:ribonuclease R
VFLGDRTDLRDLFTITIDGDDTRDIDDAVSIEQQGDTYRLGVHIADVSHYVKRGTPLDNEAYARGTSVYFPDRVLPMLPKALSNGACSLNEGEDRYALSVFITFDKEGNRLSSHICESMICSNHRTTYRQIEAIINGDKDACAQNPDLIEPVAVMTSLTYLLDKKREERGGIELDVKEAHIYIDENGELVIPDYERLCSQRLIEHFMVAANEAVAEEMHKLGVPFLYRIHEVPAPEKVATLTTFLRDLDIHVNLGDEPTPAQYARILKNVEGNPYASVVNRVMLRSMQKARYSEENVGHFGLASSCYCHFTSPIRRYPDLFIHRVIKCVLHGETDKAFKLYSSIAHEAAIDTSECERRADEAERDVDDLYKVVYLSDRIGTEYDAVISGVTSFGIFAELPNTIEGLIRLERLPEDTYEYFENRYLLKGTKHSYRIGQPIRIRVDGCDWGNMRAEFTIIEEETAKN